MTYLTCTHSQGLPSAMRHSRPLAFSLPVPCIERVVVRWRVPRSLPRFSARLQKAARNPPRLAPGRASLIHFELFLTVRDFLFQFLHATCNTVEVCAVRGDNDFLSASLLPAVHICIHRFGYRGHDPRRNVTEGGRPTHDFTASMRALANSDAVHAALVAILTDKDHPHFVKELTFCADRGYGRPTMPVDVTTNGESLADVLRKGRDRVARMRAALDVGDHTTTADMPGAHAMTIPSLSHHHHGAF